VEEKKIIWNTYVVPRFLYGLEVQNPTKKDIKKLEQLQRKVCRQFQCLPERTSSIAVYALTGAEPIAVTLNKYCINLFFGIVRLDSTIETMIYKTLHGKLKIVQLQLLC
jgi:hypothetical protein